MPPRHRFVSLVLALLLALIAVPSGLATAGTASPPEPGAWLEQPLVPWNQAGLPIPPAAPPTGFENPRCGADGRWAETPQDQSLADAGWRLFGPYRAGWSIVVVDAESSYDGMCRPLGYQSFVFLDGAFAGTISPDPMNSRETGSGTVIGIANGTVTARYIRYASTDPLCCPSLGAVVITFRIDQTPDGPVLVPDHSYTEPR